MDATFCFGRGCWAPKESGFRGSNILFVFLLRLLPRLRLPLRQGFAEAPQWLAETFMLLAGQLFPGFTMPEGLLTSQACEGWPQN